MLWIFLTILTISIVMDFVITKSKWDRIDREFWFEFSVIVGAFALLVCFANLGTLEQSTQKYMKFNRVKDDITHLRTRPETEQIGIGETIIEWNTLREKELDDLSGFFKNSITSSDWVKTQPLR